MFQTRIDVAECVKRLFHGGKNNGSAAGIQTVQRTTELQMIRSALHRRGPAAASVKFDNSGHVAIPQFIQRKTRRLAGKSQTCSAHAARCVDNDDKCGCRRPFQSFSCRTQRKNFLEFRRDAPRSEERGTSGKQKKSGSAFHEVRNLRKFFARKLIHAVFSENKKRVRSENGICRPLLHAQTTGEHPVQRGGILLRARRNQQSAQGFIHTERMRAGASAVDFRNQLAFPRARKRKRKREALCAG